MYAPEPAPKAPSNVFEKFMLTITGMSALAILFLLLLPFLACLGIGAVCLITGIGATHPLPTPTP